MATRIDVANKIFPHIDKTIADYEQQYPSRGEVKVSRFAPSPTGFLHIGGVYTSLIAWKYVQQEDGKFILRLEDTDQKRLVDGATEQIISGLKKFDIHIHEGPLGDDHVDVGEYGPYTQSQRKYIYQTFVKELIAQSKAYPCWMTQEEIDSIREQQMKTKTIPGIYGNYSVRRHKTPDDIMEKLNQEQRMFDQDGEHTFVIRLRSHGNTQKKIVFEDVLRGKVNMTDNYNDIVVLKSDGLPTYHLAHLADDYLMKTTHVIRGEEWLTSVPLHLQLFNTFGFDAPQYVHLAPLLKTEDGKKRKLSKRKDPEMHIGYLFEHGYAKTGIIEYLFTLADGHFEERLHKNEGKSYMDYTLELSNMNKAGALFDITKLRSVNNHYLSRISTKQLYDETLVRAEEYRPELATLMEDQPDYTQAAIGIERHTDKDPKRFSTFIDVEEQLRCFYDSERENMIDDVPELPESLIQEVINAFVPDYIEKLQLDTTVEEWFEQLIEIGNAHGFARNNKEFKEGGWKGKIGDLAMLLRVQLCASKKTPDLFSTMQVMGQERVANRLNKLVK